MARSILAKTETGEIQLSITIPASEVKEAYGRVFEKTANSAELSGFRKGKAPKKLVEEKVDKSKVYEEVIQEIVPQAYIEAIQEHKLEPIISPKVELLKAKEDEDWEIRATTCEAPKVELGDYKAEIKKSLGTGKLWTPDRRTATTRLHVPDGVSPGGQAEAQNSPENTEDEKTQKVIQVLLQTCQFALPQILVENEVNRALSNLLNQTEKLGMTIDQYLNSI
ncbi:MAG: trigger factor family protein, partial [bacterium]|nr:trigger factor family protein [bacterium]